MRRYFTMVDLTIRRQDKHDFAVHIQGARSQAYCEESPRAPGQRVPVGSHKARTSVQAAMLYAERLCWPKPIAESQ